MISFAVGLVLQSHSVQTLILAGDIMLNGIGIQERPLEKLSPIFRPAGTVLANLEIPLTSQKGKTANKTQDEVSKRNQFILKADPRHAALLASAGIRMVSLGNNHCMDYRQAGLEQMCSALASNHVLYAGAGPSLSNALAPSIYVDRTGKRVGLISALAFVGDKALWNCTPARANSAGVGVFRFSGVIGKKAKASLAAMFTAAKSQCDILVVGLHWGVERQSLPTAYQVSLGRACIDAGADVVWGNHPHVLQGAELYCGKPILYSMGNLISSKGGNAGVVKLVYESSKFSRAQFFPLSIRTCRVEPVTGIGGQAALKAFKGLCQLLQKRFPSKYSKTLM